MDCGTGGSNLSIGTGNIFPGTKGFCIITALGMRLQAKSRNDLVNVQIIWHPLIILFPLLRTREKSACI
jgi:hypothetical protein